MQASVYNLIRVLNNLWGRTFGYESCAFCRDRANWKLWVEPISLSDAKENKQIEYELPVCEDCFSIRPILEIMNAVKADITDNNNFCLSFRADPIYSEADMELIMDAVTALKSVYQGAQG